MDGSDSAARDDAGRSHGWIRDQTFQVIFRVAELLLEGTPMLTPKRPGPNNAQSFGQLVSLDCDGFDKLLPKTSIDHLLSEEERRKAEHERREFEAVGRTMFRTEKALYPIFYETASERMTSGVGQDEIRAEMIMLADTPDLEFASIIRQAYEDALAGRPPRFSSMV
jgi:hypothetical protein